MFDRRNGVKSVNIELKSEQEQFIRSQIESGEYQTADDVISEAFKLLASRANKIDELRQKIAVGTAEIANGQITDGELVFERLQAKIDRISRNNDLWVAIPFQIQRFEISMKFVIILPLKIVKQQANCSI